MADHLVESDDLLVSPHDIPLLSPCGQGVGGATCLSAAMSEEDDCRVTRPGGGWANQKEIVFLFVSRFTSIFNNYNNF